MKYLFLTAIGGTILYFGGVLLALGISWAIIFPILAGIMLGHVAEIADNKNK